MLIAASFRCRVRAYRRGTQIRAAAIDAGSDAYRDVRGISGLSIEDGNALHVQMPLHGGEIVFLEIASDGVLGLVFAL